VNFRFPPAETLADSPRANSESWRATLPWLALIRVTGRYRDPMIGQHFRQSGLDLVSPHVLELTRRTDFLALNDRSSDQLTNSLLRRLDPPVGGLSNLRFCSFSC